MAAKLALIDPDLLLRLLNNQSHATPPVDPNLKEINRIDDKMQTILREPQTDPGAQLKQYNALLANYGTHADNYRNAPVGPPLKIASSEKPEVDKPETDRWATDIVESLPKTVQKTGRLLLNHIKNSGGKLSWDEKGQLMLRGTVIPQTNILDLVHSVVRSRKKAPQASGVVQFVTALQELNTPTELLRNKPTGLNVDQDKPRRQDDPSTPTGFDPRDATPSRTGTLKKTRRRKRVLNDLDDDDVFQTPSNWMKL